MPVVIVLLALSAPVLGDKANSAYKAGIQAEAQNRIDAAYEDYSRAYQLKPKDARYAASYTRMRFRAASDHVHKGEVLLDAGNVPLALAEFLRAEEIDPTNALAHQEAHRARELIDKKASQTPEEAPEPLDEMADRAEGPIELHPVSMVPITLRMTESSKVVYKTIGSLVGINVIFDPEYTPRKVTIELDAVGLYDALEIVALASKTFWRPVTANTIYVIAESAGKRKDVEQSVLKTFYLSNVAAAADLTEAASAIRSLLDISRVQPIPSQNALLVRATPDQLVLVEKLLSDIDKAKGEVMIDVAIMEVTRDRLRTLGTTPPTTTSVSLQNNASNGSGGSSTFTFQSLKDLNATNFLVSIPGATFTALYSDTNTKILQNPQLRVLDNQKATLKIGDRVPVATGSFSPGIGGAGINALVNTQFQYIDVGVNIDITPRIHSRQDVTLKIAVEVSSVTGEQNIGGVTQPIIGQRRIEHETRLREGEVNLLGGILEDTQNDAISGYPLLTKIPLLRYLFGQNTRDHAQREIVFAITPHIVRAQEVTKRNLRAIDVGTPSSIELRFKDGAKTSPAGSPVSQSQAPAKSSAESATHRENTQPAAAAQPSKPEPKIAQNKDSNPARAAVSSSTSATLSFEPASVLQPVGSTFKVSVSISGGQNVFSIPLQINYDPQHLKVVDVSNGGFMSQDHQPAALVYRADSNKGALQITATRPPNSGGVSGSGNVFVITLFATSPGESVMDISGASLLDPSMQSISAVGGDLLVSISSNESPTSDEKNSTPKTVPGPDQEKQTTPQEKQTIPQEKQPAGPPQ